MAGSGKPEQPAGGTADPRQLLETLKKSAAALRRAGVRFALAGGGAAYARGGGLPMHDIDFMILPAEADAAAKALAEQGMRIVHPPEGWLLKAFDGASMVDLIFQLGDEPVTPELLERAETRRVAAARMPVLDATDLVLSMLRSFSEHYADFAGTLTCVRPLREQVDWRSVRAQTRDAPFAEAFLLLLERLGVIPPAAPPAVPPATSAAAPAPAPASGTGT